MKTIKFRVVEETTIKGYTESVKYYVQLKTLFGWKYYDTGGEYPESVKFKSKRDCFNELFKKSGRAPGHVRLKRYPTLKYVYSKKTPS